MVAFYSAQPHMCCFSCVEVVVVHSSSSKTMLRACWPEGRGRWVGAMHRVEYVYSYILKNLSLFWLLLFDS